MKIPFANSFAGSMLVVLPVTAVSAAETGQVARVDCMDMFYGVIPAEIIRGHPAERMKRHAAKMHQNLARAVGYSVPTFPLSPSVL